MRDRQTDKQKRERIEREWENYVNLIFHGARFPIGTALLIRNK